MEEYPPGTGGRPEPPPSTSVSGSSATWLTTRARADEEAARIRKALAELRAVWVAREATATAATTPDAPPPSGDLLTRIAAAKAELERLRESARGRAGGERVSEGEPVGAAQPPGPSPAEAAGPPPPTLAFDPSWDRFAPYLLGILNGAQRQLRGLIASRIADGPRSQARLALAQVLQALEALRAAALLAGGAGEPKELHLDKVLEGVLAAWDGAFRGRAIVVVRKKEPGGAAARVLGCEEAVRAALFSVARNAYEAMPRGGCLSVRLARDEGGTCVLSFSDTGPGLAPEALADPFAPFNSSKAGHLGLGLAVARRVALDLGGEVSAANGPQGGALIIFRLPPRETGAPDAA